MAEEIRKGFKDKAGNKVSIIAKVINAITGHFAGLNNNGEVVDSGYGPSDFAPAAHDHVDIIHQDSDGFARVYATSSEEDGGEVHITVKKGNGNYKSAIINDTNINNLVRALEDPDTEPTNNSGKLITSKAVYDALKALSIKLNFAASYSSGTATSLSSFTTSETFGSVGMFTGNVRVSRSRGSSRTPLTADVPVMVQVLSSTNVQVYFNNALFAHLSGTTWTIDYDGGLLIPLYYGEPAPAVDNTKYITVPPVGATLENVNAYFWFDHHDYSVWKPTSGPILIVDSTTPTTSDSAVAGQESEFFTLEDALYWNSEIPEDYAAITNKGTSYSILDVHLS